MSVGTVVEDKSVLLGQEKDCACGGKSQAGFLSTRTSAPDYNGMGYGRYCTSCKKRDDLSTKELEQAKADYAGLGSTQQLSSAAV